MATQSEQEQEGKKSVRRVRNINTLKDIRALADINTAFGPKEGISLGLGYKIKPRRH